MCGDVESKFIGGLIGTGIGDGLGRSREGYSMVDSEKIIKIGRKSNKFVYTDDTQQMIGLTESLIHSKGFDGKAFANKLVQNFDISRGYGSGAIQVIRSLKDGSDWREPAKKLFGGEGSYGNGSSMRIAPIGLFKYDDLEGLSELAISSSKVTHTHRLGVEGAKLQALSVGLALRKDPKDGIDKQDFIHRLLDFIEEDIYLEKLKLIRSLVEKNIDKRKVIKDLGNGVEAYNSVPTALYSFLSNSSNFRDSVTYGISLGGDADTIGAMTGAISGAYHGKKEIPKEWKSKLENKDRIINLAKKLMKTKKEI